MESNVLSIKGLELEYRFLYNKHVKDALDKVFTAPLHGPVLSNVVKLHKAVESNFTKLKVQYEALVKEYAELDEKGAVIEPDGPGSFKIREDKLKDWPSAVQKFMTTKFVIEKGRKINAQMLINSGISLSSSDLINLSPILDGVEDI